MHTVRLQYSRRPRLLPIYALGLLPRLGGAERKQTLPLIRSEWRNFRVDNHHFRRFMNACGLEPSDAMPLVYPLLLVFPLHVSTFCHRKFPLRFVRMMQIRNHVLQHRQIEWRETLDITCEIVGQRVVTKGMEMDIHSALQASGDPVWESIHTYFFPGRFSKPDPPSRLAQLPPLPEQHETTTWTMPREGGFCFGLMAGDFNPIHYLAPYARLMGFDRDFAHSQLTLALCIRHLPPQNYCRPVRLDAALKGPVYYGSKVRMNHARQGGGSRFDLYCAENQRPCISGSLVSGEPDVDLIRDSHPWGVCH